MNMSAYVGRAGALAVALGAGGAFLAGGPVASADTGSPDTVGSSATSPAVRGAAHPGSRHAAERQAPATQSPAVTSGHAVGRGTRNPLPQPLAMAKRTAATGPARPLPPIPTAAATALASAPVPQSAPINPDAIRPNVSVAQLFTTVASSFVGLAQSAFREFSIAGYLGPTHSTLNQTLTVNGYSMVPSSTELVTAAYGQWTYWPGGPTLIQGQQQYSVIDPATQQSIGTFDALVSTGSPFNVRSKYVELLVTANDGTNVGPGAGQIPPVGSLISRFNLLGGFGWSYTAMPAAPTATVRFALTTPFGDIPVRIKFDASKGIADHTVDNRPVELGNGYSIAPADPTGETYVGTSGFLPTYTAVQAREVFNLRDPSGATVGSFEGVVTPTADLAGVYTQALLVTKVLSGTTGTTPGEVPPVGSVVNVMYQWRDDRYVRYVSMPSASGNVVSVVSVNGATVKNIRTFPLNLLDASALPTVQRLPASGGYSFLPTSPLLPSGVNGLPPREIQVQGYQQFGVYDSAGVQQGSFDADVATQVDMYGIHSQSILVTKVTNGAAGTAPGQVPPAGSVFNYVYFGKGGFGTSYSSMPDGSGAAVSFKVLTPIIDIPTWSTYNASAGLAGVSFFDPFA